jgi:pimeloyl-ACP methyl ester carboxylesterase
MGRVFVPLLGVVPLLVLSCRTPNVPALAAGPEEKAMPIQMQSEITGSGEPLVLVPGGLTGWVSFEPHAARLSAERSVVRVQLLSVQYGLEGRELGPSYSVKTESAALAAALDARGISSPVDLVAWSFGALTTLDFALDHPERVRSLVLIEPPALWLLDEVERVDPRAAADLAAFEKLHGDITEDMLEDFLRSAGFAPPGSDVRALPQWPRWLPFRQSLRNTPAVLAHKDDPVRLSRLGFPVLLVKGTGSSWFLHRIIDHLAERLPHAEVVEWPAGHAPHIVSMEPFLERLRSFHGSVGAPAG